MVEDKENLDSIRKLYPHMTDYELRRAKANLRRYVEIALRIHRRLESEGKE